MAQGVFTPYSTVSGFSSALPAWVPVEEQERINAYQTYEEIYWNHPETFKLMLRGQDSKPVYIPSGRTIVDTICRFFARKFSVNYFGTDAEDAKLEFENLFARERFRSKLSNAKKYGVIRGDWLFHVTADATKEPGRRLSIHVVDPASYFPVYDTETATRIVKVHLAEEFKNEAGEARVRRQTYEKAEGGILSSLSIFEIDKWAEGDATAEQVVNPPTLLPPQITQIPVYHVRNMAEEGNPYGSSEMRGLERLMSSINQAMSDEDIALALEGLGVYRTSNGAPVDEEGNETDWALGPGRVVEDGTFERIPGISSVAPFKDHIMLLDGFLKEASGTPDSAVGKVDVQVAESGVALALQMSPILARAEDKELEVTDVLSQMFFDLKSWFAAYEQKSLFDCVITPQFGDPLPKNIKAEVELVLSMMMSVPPLMSATTGRERLSALGIQFADDEFKRILEEASAMADSQASALGAAVDDAATEARRATELAGVGE